MNAGPNEPRGAVRLLSNSLWSIFGIAFAGIVQFISVPIVIRHVGADDYGLYVLALTIGGMLLLADLGLNEATIRYVAKYHAESDWMGVNRVYGATLSVYWVVGLACSAALVGGAPWIVGWFHIGAERLDLAANLLRCAGLTFLVTIWVGVLEAVPQAILRFDVLSKARFLFLTGHGLGVIAVVGLGYGVLGLGLWLLAARIVYFFGLSVVVQRLMPRLRLRPSPTRAGLREVFGYGIFSALNALIARAADSVDRLVLGALFGPREVAFLTVPRQVLDFAASVHNAAGGVLFPLFSAMTDSSPGVRSIFLRGLSVLSCLGLIIFVPTIVILPDFIRLWIGDEFAAKSATVAQIIGVSFALQASFVVYFTFLKGTGRVHWLTTINATCGLLGLVIAIRCILDFGFLGAGLRTLALVWVGYLVIGLILARILGDPSPMITLVRFLFAPIIAAGMAGFVALKYRPLAPIDGWLDLALFWVSLAGILVVILVGVTYVVQGEDSPVRLLIQRIDSWRRRAV